MADSVSVGNVAATVPGVGLHEQTWAQIMASDEPEWLKAKRQEAWQAAQRMELPNWRYMDAGRFRLDEVAPLAATDFDAAVQAAPAEVQALAAGEASGAGLVLQVDASARTLHLNDELRRQGVILTDMTTAVREHGDLVRRYLFSQGTGPQEDRFLALHAALWSGGFFLYVPADVEVKNPFYYYQTISRAGVAAMPHNLIVLDRGAVATVFEEQASEEQTAGPQPYNGAYTEIYLEDGAQLQYLLVDRWGQDVTEVSRRQAFVGRDARFDSTTAYFGGGMLHTEVLADLVGPGGSSELLCMMLTAGEQHLDIVTANRHVAPHTTGEMWTRQALRGASRTGYQGLIIIEQSAPHSRDYLQENALLLDDRARADVVPGLEINNDEVAASHGATLGRVDEAQLFYLMSRGIPRAQAELLLVQGFLAPLLERVPNEQTRERLAALVAEKAGGAE